MPKNEQSQRERAKEVLKELAKKAKPLPDNCRNLVHTDTGIYCLDEDSRKFWEAASPSTVTALLEEVEELNSQINRALSILWKDIDAERDDNLPLILVAAKAGNAIHWRNHRIEAAEAERDRMAKDLKRMEEIAAIAMKAAGNWREFPAEAALTDKGVTKG